MPPRPRLTCVLFDLDGTLVDTTDLIFASYRHAVRALLGYTPSDDALLAFYGLPLAEAMREFLPAVARTGGKQIEAATETDRPVASVQAQAGVVAHDESLVERLVQVYREFNLAQHDALIRSFPGVSETLAELKVRGYRLGVVTSKGRRTTTLSLGRYDLERFMATVVTLEDTPVHKPNPDPVLKALERLGQPASRTLFVGDSVYDLQAGQAAGVRVGAALWGPFARADLEAQAPDFLFDSIADLLAVCPPLEI